MTSRTQRRTSSSTPAPGTAQIEESATHAVSRTSAPPVTANASEGRRTSSRSSASATAAASATVRAVNERPKYPPSDKPSGSTARARALRRRPRAMTGRSGSRVPEPRGRESAGAIRLERAREHCSCVRHHARKVRGTPNRALTRRSSWPTRHLPERRGAARTAPRLAVRGRLARPGRQPCHFVDQSAPPESHSSASRPRRTARGPGSGPSPTCLTRRTSR